MSTLTPNLNLVLPIGVEKVSRQIINTNMTLIDTAVGGKINITDIVNNLTTNDPTKVLSAAQGYALNSKLSNMGFAVVTATIPSTVNGTNDTDIPTGYDYTNTIINGVQATLSDNYSSDSYSLITLYELGVFIHINYGRIRIETSATADSRLLGRSIKILICKSNF